MIDIEINQDEVINLIASSCSLSAFSVDRVRRNRYLSCYWLSKGLSFEEVGIKLNVCSQRIIQLKNLMIRSFCKHEREESLINYIII